MKVTIEELEAEKRRLLFRLKKSFIESRSMQGSPTYSEEYANGRGWESDRLSLERVERELRSLKEAADQVEAVVKSLRLQLAEVTRLADLGVISNDERCARVLAITRALREIIPGS